MKRDISNPWPIKYPPSIFPKTCILTVDLQGRNENAEDKLMHQNFGSVLDRIDEEDIIG